VRLYPNSPVGYVDCAYAYLNSGRLDLALRSADKALDVSPIDAEALRVKAIAYSEQQANNEAQKAFEAALALEPNNPEIMRDYYHHLRNVGNFPKMVKYAQTVIRMERPYCIEDYWFLADFYREQGDNLKAFHFLHRAYESMPGEKELIPPMIDIMLDTGHVRYTTPFLKHYAEKNGWNDVMIQFARHKRLKGKWNQEGVRFLRYYCQKPADFRKYIFLVHLEKFMIAGLLLLFPFLAAFCFIIKGIPGIIFLTAISVLLAAGWKTAKLLFKW
jgi:tetratricopeptide (TPR) repeat protein